MLAIHTNTSCLVGAADVAVELEGEAATAGMDRRSERWWESAFLLLLVDIG